MNRNIPTYARSANYSRWLQHAENTAVNDWICFPFAPEVSANIIWGIIEKKIGTIKNGSLPQN